MSTPVPATIGLSLNLARALDLARRGEYRAAQRALSANGEPPENATALHAYAAVITATGDYPRALHFWRLLQTRDPGHPEARRMIAAIELWQSRPWWYRFVPAAAALALVLVVAAVAWSAFSTTPPKPKPAAAPLPARYSAPTASPVSPVRPAVSEPLPTVQFKLDRRPAPGTTSGKRKPAR
jgi:hypothetical protein